MRIRLLSGEKATESTSPANEGNVWSKLPVCAFQSLAVLSSLPVRRYLPLGEKATESTTLPECFRRVKHICPVFASQSLAVLSQLPVRTHLPSGEKATATTFSLCPLRLISLVPLAAFQIIAVLS